VPFLSVREKYLYTFSSRNHRRKEESMLSNPNMVRNVIITFAIGFIAAISPFLFMQLLPSLLNPTLNLGPPNYLAIILTGLLVGAITSILFANQFEKKGPQDIFFYALGIPAILIATVSNLSTEFKAVTQISDAKERLTSVVLNPPQPRTAPGEPVLLTPPLSQQQGMNSRNLAWADEKEGDGRLLFAQAHGYLVVIGEYQTEKSAWEDYRKLREERLRTERYSPKDLGVFEIRKGYYVLAYSRCSSLGEANRVYQLLRINDPGLNVKILKY
jgi:hypothetical protein